MLEIEQDISKKIYTKEEKLEILNSLLTKPTPKPQYAVTINIDASTAMGQIRSFQGVNGGPALPDSLKIFPEDYLDMGIDLVRNHGGYGSTDIDAIFPNFNADPNDPDNYDFEGADRYVKAMKDIGADIYFRLGYGLGWAFSPAFVGEIGRAHV